MADALISPAVGGVMWGVSAGMILYCSKKVRAEMDDRNIPLMGVLGAFIFAAQMINFTIPATGSSGHLGGGMILSILLGPYAAFLTIASVLVVQAFFFADGGLLALGCNIFNLGIFPAFIAYPFIYKPLSGSNPTKGKITIASMVSGIVALQIGAFSVVLETVTSGISSLPFSTFLLLMQPIHLAIGIVEGLVTASVVAFVYNARPEIIVGQQTAVSAAGMAMRNLVMTLFAAALLAGGFVSLFASENPDGLEWSIKKVTGKEEVSADKTGLHGMLDRFQEKLAFLPDYNFKKPDAAKKEGTVPNDISAHNRLKAAPPTAPPNKEGSKLGSSIAGVLGGVMTLALAFAIGFVLRKSSTPQQA